MCTKQKPFFTSCRLVRAQVCGALRVLTYDDDVRVPFGKGHEHAKMIVTEQDALSKIMLISKGTHVRETFTSGFIDEIMVIFLDLGVGPSASRTVLALPSVFC